MTAQIYDTNNNNFFSVYIPKEPPYQYYFYLGEFSQWTAIKNTENEFISLGGDKENPLIYKYQDTGVTDFTFSILGPTYPEQRNLPPGKAIYPSLAYYELWIDGIKPYYFYFGSQNETIFTRTVSVVANKDQTTKFRFRLTFYFSAATYEELQKFYFYGKEDTVYSSITAKYIPDAAENKLGKSEPIIVKEDTTLKKNRRYLVYALYGKTLQLNLDDPEEFEIGDWIELKNMEFGKFQLNSKKYDIVMQGKSTKSKKGFIKSISRGDFVRLECLEKSSDRIILSDTNTIGAFTFI